MWVSRGAEVSHAQLGGKGRWGGGSSSGGLLQADLCQVLWEGCLCSSSQPRLGGGVGRGHCVHFTEETGSGVL